MKLKLLTLLPLIAGLAFISTGAQAAEPESESFKKYGQEFKGKIGKTYAESEEWYPEGVKPKPGTPNVLTIYLDDVGFAQYGSFGGLIKTPNIDALAADGRRWPALQ
jgi:arylsulfatase